MSDYKLPDLPSDEELGIAGMDLDEEDQPPPRAAPDKGAGEPPPRPPPTAPQAGPRRPWRGPLTLLALAVLAWASSSQRYLPSPVPANAPDTVFSSARAMVELVRIAQRPHPPGSPEHARVREHLIGRLEELGLEPEVQTTTSLLREGAAVRGATVRNVVARLPGTSPTGALLLTAHYDSREISPGAGDDASGVAAILETLRALAAGPALRNDVIVLLADAEELGLLGARAFVAEHRWMGDVTLVVSVEMRGGGGPSIMFETAPRNGWVIEALQASGARPYANSLSFEVYRRLPNDTDFTPFVDAGRQGLNFAGIGRAHVYHQAYDDPAHFREGTLQHHGENLLAVTRELGDAELTSTLDPDRVFFSLPLVGVVTYPPSWGWALAGLLVALAALALVLVRRAGGAWGGVLVGLLLGVIASGGSAAAAWGLFLQLRARHPEYGRLQGSAFHSEGWYVLAVAAIALLLVTGMLALGRRRFPLAPLALGALLLPLLAATAAVFVAPLGAMNLQWPTLAALVSVLVVLGTGPRRRPGGLAWGLLLVLALPVLALLVPLTELLWAAMSFAQAPLIGTLAAFTLLLLLPLLDALRDPNGWWAPLLSLLLAAGFLGIGLLAARPSAERPAPSTLVYLLDRESGRSLWATRAGAGLEWAAGRVGGTFGEERTLEEFQLGRRGYRLADAPPFQVAALEVGDDAAVGDTAQGGAAAAAPAGETVASAAGDTLPTTAEAPLAAEPADTAGLAAGPSTRTEAPSPSGRVRVTLALRSAAGAEALWIRLPESTGARIASVNGRELSDPGPAIPGPGVRSLVHWGEPEGGRLVLELEMDAREDPVPVEVVEHLLRPVEVVGAEPFQRPPELAPDVPALSDRALIRSVVRVSPAGVASASGDAPPSPPPGP